jgi:hypothetical protein
VSEEVFELGPEVVGCHVVECCVDKGGDAGRVAAYPAEGGSCEWRGIRAERSGEINIKKSCSMVRKIDIVEGIEATVLNPW